MDFRDCGLRAKACNRHFPAFVPEQLRMEPIDPACQSTLPRHFFGSVLFSASAPGADFARPVARHCDSFGLVVLLQSVSRKQVSASLLSPMHTVALLSETDVDP